MYFNLSCNGNYMYFNLSCNGNYMYFNCEVVTETICISKLEK